jgi:O-antigen/teichoic acid export membrane protein
MARNLLRNALSNWTGYAVHMAVALLLTPYILHAIGAERYSVWVLVIGVTGYYGLLDLGLRSAITQYLVRHLTQQDYAGVNRSASTAFAALAGCAVVILALTGLGVYWGPEVFSVAGPLRTEMQCCLALLGVALAVQVLLAPYSSVFIARERFDLANLIGISVRLLTAASSVFVIEAGYGLIGLSFVIAAGNTLDACLRCWGAYRLLPTLRVSLADVRRKEMWQLATFGGWNVLGQSSQRLIYYSDEIVIGLFLPFSNIAPYAIAVAVANHFVTFFSPLASVIYPVATQLDTDDAQTTLRKLYLKSSRALLLLVVCLGAIAAVWSRDFFNLWVGSQFASPVGQTPIAVLFLILLGSAMITSGQRIGYQVAMGMRKLQWLALLFVLEGATNVLLSIWLVHSYGTLGVAIGTLIPATLYHGIAHPWLLCRLLQIPRGTFVSQVYGRAITGGLLVWILLATMHRFLPAPESWFALIGHGLLAMGVALPIAAVMGLDREVRNRWLIQPATRLARVFAPA